jgi:long-chain acyl-CoA synthetase
LARRIPGGPLFEVPVLRSVPEMLQATARRRPDATAIIEPQLDDSVRKISYRDLSSEVDSLARSILEEHPSPVVGVVGRNSISWATVYLATLRAGGVIVPIDRELPVQEMRAILHYSGANMIFLDSSYLQDFAGSGHGRGLTMVVMNGPTGAGFQSISERILAGGSSVLPPPEEVEVRCPSAIYYTSGTMGSAKGVVLTQENLLAVVSQELQFVRLLPEDIFLSVLPMHHTYECTCGFLTPLTNGSTYYICRGLRYVAEDIARSGATVVMAVPLLWEAMYRKILDGIHAMPGGRMKHRIGMILAGAASALAGQAGRKAVFSQVHARLGGRIRLMVSGGAGVDPEISRGFLSLGFTFLQGYGLTEAGPLVSVNREKANRPESVGPPLAGIEVLINEPDEEGVGEIVIKGPNVMLGYHNDPEETSRVLTPDGWLRTGDFGFLDSDGFLHISGRKKNVIIAKNGKNVYPEEIETRLNRSDIVLESMVFGRESKTKGEEIWTIIVPDTEKLILRAEDRGENLTREFAAEVIGREIRHFNASQPLYKRISSFIIREEELPKTTTRKIRRREILREAGLEQEAVFRV